MGFGLVRFPAGDSVGPHRSSSHIEIAERRVPQAVDLVEPTEHVFHQELGFSVNIGGLVPGVFGDRNGFRLAVNSRRGGKHDLAGSVGDHRFQKA